jgi:hypothetical protein
MKKDLHEFVSKLSTNDLVYLLYKDHLYEPHIFYDTSPTQEI